VEEKWLHVGAERAIRRLKDCVGDAVTDFQPLATQIGVGMVDIPGDVDGVVVLARKLVDFGLLVPPDSSMLRDKPDVQNVNDGDVVPPTA
jgi:hypothetical protein